MKWKLGLCFVLRSLVCESHQNVIKSLYEYENECDLDG